MKLKVILVVGSLLMSSMAHAGFWKVVGQVVTFPVRVVSGGGGQPQGGGMRPDDTPRQPEMTSTAGGPAQPVGHGPGPQIPSTGGPRINISLGGRPEAPTPAANPDHVIPDPRTEEEKRKEEIQNELNAFTDAKLSRDYIVNLAKKVMKHVHAYPKHSSMIKEAGMRQTTVEKKGVLAMLNFMADQDRDAEYYLKHEYNLRPQEFDMLLELRQRLITGDESDFPDLGFALYRSDRGHRYALGNLVWLLCSPMNGTRR